MQYTTYLLFFFGSQFISISLCLSRMQTGNKVGLSTLHRLCFSMNLYFCFFLIVFPASVTLHTILACLPLGYNLAQLDGSGHSLRFGFEFCFLFLLVSCYIVTFIAFFSRSYADLLMALFLFLFRSFHSCHLYSC